MSILDIFNKRVNKAKQIDNIIIRHCDSHSCCMDDNKSDIVNEILDVEFPETTQMEQPKRVSKYNKKVWETPTMDFLRKNHCMCHNCDRMKPTEPDHCKIAQSFYAICKEHGTAFILTRCESWKEK